jgi:guanylate kinase
MLQVVIAGPSGVGKGTLVNLMMKHYPVNLAFFLS